VLKTDFKVESVGKPDIRVLSAGESHNFFETLFSRITEIYSQNRKRQD